MLWADSREKQLTKFLRYKETSSIIRYVTHFFGGEGTVGAVTSIVGEESIAMFT